MEQQKDWTEQLRKRLEHHQAAVPDDLWAGIEAALDAQKARQRKARIVVMRRRLAAAAVVCAVAVGSMVYLQQHQGEAAMLEQTGAANLAAASGSQPAVASTSTDVQGLSPMTEEAPLLATLPGKIVRALRGAGAGEPAACPDSQQDLHENQTAEEPSDKSGQTEMSTQKNPNHQPEQTEKTEKKAHTVQPERPFYTAEVASRGSRRNARRLTFALAASGTMGRGNSTDAPLSLQAPLYFGDRVANSTVEEVSVGKSYEEKKHHNQPVSVGLSVSYGLTDRLSVASGLVYTWATSEFTYSLRSTSQQETQTLRYVGVPLKASYVVWKNSRVKTYASVGGQADFNVSATVETENGKSDIDKDRLQLSTQASVGVEYDVVPQVGIYVEPGVKYYFDNGSRIENIFKEKPCRFDLQLGVRFNLGGNR